MHHLKIEVHHLREECFRIKKIAHHRIEKLYERIVHFVRLEKEIRCLFEKMEGLCHVEDVMREEIHFERGHYEAGHHEEIHIRPFEEEHHFVSHIVREEVVEVVEHIDVVKRVVVKESHREGSRRSGGRHEESRRVEVRRGEGEHREVRREGEHGGRRQQGGEHRGGKTTFKSSRRVEH